MPFRQPRDLPLVYDELHYLSNRVHQLEETERAREAGERDVKARQSGVDSINAALREAAHRTGPSPRIEAITRRIFGKQGVQE